MALEVGSRLGHYDVTALIGEGGMGQVYQEGQNRTADTMIFSWAEEGESSGTTRKTLDKLKGRQEPEGPKWTGWHSFRSSCGHPAVIHGRS